MPTTKFPAPGPRKASVEVTSFVDPLYLNREQLAQAITTSARTIDNWREQGIIPFLKIRGVVRFDLNKVKAALEGRFEIRERK